MGAEAVGQMVGERSEARSAAVGPDAGRSIVRQVAWLAGPVLVEQALLYLVGLSDTILTGRYLGTPDLAAVTVSSYLIWFLGSLMMVVSAGATALVARLIGAGDREGAIRLAQQAMGLAWSIGTALMVGGLVAAPTIVSAMNLGGTAADQAVLYLRVVLLSTPFLASETVGNACLRGAGDTRTGMWAMAAVNLVNVGLSWGLVAGLAGLPRLGLLGVAIGTAVGEAVGGVFILAAIAKGRGGFRLRLREVVPTIEPTRRILRISLPAAGEALSNGIFQLIFLGMINGLGATATAAHGVAIRCEAIAFLTVAAFAVPAGTLAGQYLGAGRPDLAKRAAMTSWGLAVASMVGLGIVLFAASPTMFRLFLGRDQPGVAAMGVPALRLVAFALPALATIVVLSGALRGAGDTRWPWAFVLIGYLAVRLPLTAYLIAPADRGGLGWGLWGAWAAMFADLHVRAALVAVRFVRGRWLETRV